jgi:hypothetical protein
VTRQIARFVRQASSAPYSDQEDAQRAGYIRSLEQTELAELEKRAAHSGAAEQHSGGKPPFATLPLKQRSVVATRRGCPLYRFRGDSARTVEERATSVVCNRLTNSSTQNGFRMKCSALRPTKEARMLS